MVRFIRGRQCFERWRFVRFVVGGFVLFSIGSRFKESIMAVKIGFSSSDDIKRLQAINAVNDARLQAVRAGGGSVNVPLSVLFEAFNGVACDVLGLLDSTVLNSVDSEGVSSVYNS